MGKKIEYFSYIILTLLLLIVACNYFKGNTKFKAPSNYDINMTKDISYWEKSIGNCFK